MTKTYPFPSGPEDTRNLWLRGGPLSGGVEGPEWKKRLVWGDRTHWVRALTYGHS